jgi:hypothetical protein
MATFGGTGKGSEFFDLYSNPFTTLYSQVYWTQLGAVPLPPHIVSRFAGGKVMALTGWEADQVLKGAGPNGTDVSVPITWSYNHHHGGALIGASAHLARVTPRDGAGRWAAASAAAAEEGHGMLGSGGREEAWVVQQVRPTATRAPGSATLNSGNGGEFRKSYHGFPKGFAQLVESPVQWSLQVMQIDSWNRAEMPNVSSPFVPGPVPRGNNLTGLAHRAGSLAPHAGEPGATYSGLLECPCSSRITKTMANGGAVRLAAGVCPRGGGWGAAECFAAAARWAGSSPAMETVSDPALPAGCSINLGKKLSRYRIVWNDDASSVAPCGGGDGAITRLAGASAKNMATNVTLAVDLALGGNSSSVATLTLTGPADVWFGVGLNASTMSDQPYALIVAGGTGSVTERRLVDEGPGTELSPASAAVVSNDVDAKTNTRTVVLRAPVAGPYFVFDPRGLELPFLSAVGSGAALAYHRAKTSDVLELAPRDAGVPTCVCASSDDVPFGLGAGDLAYNAGAGATASGSNAKVGFHKRCNVSALGEKNDMLAQHNSECDVRTYVGGQSCCHHLWSLLDLEQEIPWRDQPLTVQHKWRFWFEEVDTATSAVEDVSPENVCRLAYTDMATPTEYEVPQCAPGTPAEACIHEITAEFQARDILPRDASCKAAWHDAKAVGLVTAHGHCHAPTCLSMELYNADTGVLLCRQAPLYGGTGAPSLAGGRFDEPGYIATPPCVWSNASDGVEDLLLLPMDTNLSAVARTNNTFGHHGEMALWQMYGVLRM